MYKKEYPIEISLACGHLSRFMRGKHKLDLAIFNGTEAAVTDLNNRNQRPATVSVQGDCVYCTFENLMDYQQFEAALESHGFK
ncbi:MAG: hypothetical protein NTZ38_01315 [Candidatus Taylorbacteria bacterium]|nr:hypothetical protein [Candidatus Taylorbacteria bacterium]